MHSSGNNPIDGSSSSSVGVTVTYGMTPEQASREFDVLRREATKLERHLEDRVARYQQVSSIYYVDNCLNPQLNGFYFCIASLLKLFFMIY